MAQISTGLISVLETNGAEVFLRSNGNQATFSDLEGKVIGLYFTALSSEVCQPLTQPLIETYNELISLKDDFEIILISLDEDEESFHKHFSTMMPWLAIPHSNQTARDRFKGLYAIEEIPQLVLLNAKGDLISRDGLSLVFRLGATGYPFTPERIKQLEEEEETQRKNQTLKSVLATTHDRNFLISSDGEEVPISELEGKVVGLYISLGSFRSCQNFTPKLVDLYRCLKEKGESFEIVYVSLEDDKESFEKEFTNMPWLAIPFGDKAHQKLPYYFVLNALPTLVMLGPDGKTLHLNVCEYVEEFGIQAYPFSAEKILELEELRDARRESQTLESLLFSDEIDFVIGKDALKVPVSELVGKTVLFYFSRLECPPCREFTPKLAKAYHEIKTKHPDFEVIFVSRDNSEGSFEQYYAEMPWLALPYDDKRETLINLTIQYDGIPHLAAFGPDGKIISNEAKELVMFFGSDAYPFDEDRRKEMDSRLKEMSKEKEFPEKVRENVDDDKPREHGNDDAEGQAAVNEGWICDGNVCYKA